MQTETVLNLTDSDKARMRNEIRQQIVGKLTNKEYRDIWFTEQINTGLSFQIRGLREQRGWSQAELGKRTGMAQSRISLMEDANYARFSLTTLKRLASAFDVGLMVRFRPYSGLVDDFVELDSSVLNMPGFEEDTFTSEAPPTETFDLEALNSIAVTSVSGAAISESYKFVYQDTANISSSQGLFFLSELKERPLSSNIAQQALAA